MHPAKRYLLIAVCFAIALTVFTAFAPRVAHAVAAAMVQVTNTSANPVPVTVAGTISILLNNTLPGQPSNYIVPDGNTLTIEHVLGQCGDGSAVPLVVNLKVENATGTGWIGMSFNLGSLENAAGVINQPMKLVLPAASSIAIENGESGGCLLYFSGHLQ